MQVQLRFDGVDEARLTAMASAAGASVEETAQSILISVLADDARMHEAAPAVAEAPEAEVSTAQIKAIKAFASVGHGSKWIASQVGLPIKVVKSILKSK